MAKKCTKKKPMFGNNRPFSLKATKTVQKVNLQTVMVDGEKVKMSVREAKKYKNTDNKSAKAETAQQ